MFSRFALALISSLMLFVQVEAASITGSYTEELSDRLKLVLLFDDPVNPEITKKGTRGAVIGLPNVNSLKLKGLRETSSDWYRIVSEQTTATSSEIEIEFNQDLYITAFPSARYNRELGTMFVIYLKPSKPLTALVDITPINAPASSTVINQSAEELSDAGKILLDERFPLPESREEARALLLQRIDEGVKLLASGSSQDPKSIRTHLKSLKDVLQKFIQGAPISVKERIVLQTKLVPNFEAQIADSVATLASDLDAVSDTLSIQVVSTEESAPIFRVDDTSVVAEPDMPALATETSDVATVVQIESDQPAAESVTTGDIEPTIPDETETPVEVAVEEEPMKDTDLPRVAKSFDPIVEQMELYIALFDQLTRQSSPAID